MQANSKSTKISYQAPSRAGPVRPAQMRGFSTNDDKPKSGFFDFLKNVEKVDEEVA